MSTREAAYLSTGLPAPVPYGDGLDAPYWNGLREERLRIQQCRQCATWRFGPEWICHHCHGFEHDWRDVAARGRIYSWERVWHPAHPALKTHGAYLVVLVELEAPQGIRMLGNLLGDPHQEVRIGAPVIGVFEHHSSGQTPFSLLHWRIDPAGQA